MMDLQLLHLQMAQAQHCQLLKQLVGVEATSVQKLALIALRRQPLQRLYQYALLTLNKMLLKRSSPGVKGQKR